MISNGRDRAILLVEDSPQDIQLVMRSSAELRLPHPVIHVPDGVEACKYFQRADQYADPHLFPPPCLVLLNIDLPRLNGLQFLIWLRQQPNLNQPPVVVLTHSPFAPELETAYGLGADSFLTKRLAFEDFLAAMQQTCDFWVQSSGLAPTT